MFYTKDYVEITHVDQIGFDYDYAEHIIKDVEDDETIYSVTVEDGWTTGFDKDKGLVPKVGDTLRIYPKTTFFLIRGMALNDRVIRYESEEEAKLRTQYEFAKQARNDAVIQWEQRDSITARLAALPSIMQERMYRFEQEEPGFLLKSDAMYELFILEEAVKIARTLKTVEEVTKWQSLDYKDQKLHVSISDGHSGNTFGAACAFARHLIQEEELELEKV